jgi:hypothetical protein
VEAVEQVESGEYEEDIPFMLQVEVIDGLEKGPIQTLNIINQYVGRLGSLNLRDPDKTWIKISEAKVVPLRPIGYIQFVKTPKAPPETRAKGF